MRYILKMSTLSDWHFEVADFSDEKEAAKLFSVPDFVGDAAKAIASRIRGAVAGTQFDDFHKNSAQIIRASVFGLDTNQRVRDQFVFPQNNLVITSIDIQSVEPVDQRTRDALQKSVQLAIEVRFKGEKDDRDYDCLSCRSPPTLKKLPLNTKLRVVNKKRKVYSNANVSKTKLKPKMFADNFSNCKLNQRLSNPPVKLKLKLKVERNLPASKAKQLSTKVRIVKQLDLDISSLLSL